MAPQIVMIVACVVFRLAGAIGVLDVAASWSGALRLALAVMFTFTASSHFAPRTRADLVRMVPPGMPNPEALVSITGVLEFLGAMGLLVPVLLQASAYALIALLVALFPANIYAARKGLLVAGRQATPLIIRLPLQLFWIGALWWVAPGEIHGA
jgi:uncharacterized membrane protein